MPIEYCADVIAFYDGSLVLVERLKPPCGLALPGGHVEENESLMNCVLREFTEETGLSLTITDVWQTRASPDRDPRGNKVSTIFVGAATGSIRDETGATHVVLLDPERAVKRKDKFVFDHFETLKEYFDSH